jgi:tetratricopeptide (TPR) repeat protein
MEVQESNARWIGLTGFLIGAILILNCTTATAARPGSDDRKQALQTMVSAASSAQARGDFSAAAEAFRKATAIDPSIPELWANLGLMYHESGNRPEAIQSFKKSIQINPSLFVPQLFLGIEYLANQEPETAISFLKTAAKLNPNDLQAQVSLGKANSMLGRGGEAAEAYWRATEIAPRDGSAWLGLGTAYLQQVENDARLMSSRYANSSYSNLRAAETFAEQGKLVEAEAAFKSATAAPFLPPCAHAEYGISLLRMNKLSEAEHQFLLEKQNATPCGLTSIAEAFKSLEQGNTNDGLGELSSLALTDPNFLQASLPMFRGILSEQTNVLERSIRAKQASGEITSQVGDLLVGALFSDNPVSREIVNENKSIDASVSGKSQDLELAVAANRYSGCAKELKVAAGKLTPAQQNLPAHCSFYSGDFHTAALAAESLKVNPSTAVQGLYWESKADQKRAVAALSRAGELEPNSPQMWMLIGDAFRQKRRWTEAEADYRKAIALDPRSRTARLDLAIVLFTELKNDEAFELDKSLLNEIPNDPEANLLAGEILVQQHEFEKAEPYLHNCGKLAEDLQPRLHVLLGEVYGETNRISDAIVEYKMGLSTDHDGSIHYQLARLYQKAGNSAAAAEQILISQQIRQRWDNQAHIALEQRSTDLSRQ